MRSSALRKPTQAALGAQAAQAGANSRGAVAGRRFDGAFAFQRLHDGGRVQSADLAQVARSFQQAHIVVGVKTIPALAAMGVRKSHAFPSSDRRRRNPYETGDVTDFEIGFAVARHDFRMCLLAAPWGCIFSA